MRQAIVFTIIAICWIVLAGLERGLAGFHLWPAFAFLVVAGGYAGLGPKVFGKRDDGSMRLLNAVILAPYVWLAWGIWFALARLTRESPCSEVLPGLCIGRRVGFRDLPDVVEWIVDLTCEFWEPSRVRRIGRYTCLPTLDHATPDPRGFVALAQSIASTQASTPVFIHCAQGHGRSALLVCAVLMCKGVVANATEAEEFVRRARPAIRLSTPQRAFLERVLALQHVPIKSP